MNPIVQHGYGKGRRDGSTRTWRNIRAHILAGATHCGICGQPARAGDPFEVDHITAVADGGTDHPSNLRAAHRSCNRQRGRA